MVDEKMLVGIKTVLSKVDSYKNDKDIGKYLSEFGIDITDMTQEQIVSCIVKYLLNDEERYYFNQYSLYSKKVDVESIASIINSLSDLTELVDILYRERKEAGMKISYINDIVRKIKLKLNDFPMIRLKCLYGHLENDYKRYNSTFIKAGLDETRISDTIYNIEHGSFVLRQMKTKELARLKKELATHKRNSSKEIEEKHEKYTRTREEYTKELENAVLELLRDPVILNAIMLSINSLGDNAYNTELDHKGIERIEVEELHEVSKKAIIDKFFVYYAEHNDEKYDAQTFYNILEKFILHFYTRKVEILEGKRNVCLRQIGDAFDKQKGMMGDLKTHRESFGNSVISMSDDESDTLALVYTKNGV